ncbi:MAG TPA: NYN domain-containing protein [Dehalococcoidia bacterium]|nr:NYN domain-containing protein [Dehalococcoidia bacterium]
MPVTDAHRAYVFIDAGHLRDNLTQIGANWRKTDLGTIGRVLMTRFNHLPKWLDVEMRLSRVFVYDAIGDSGDPEVEEWLRLTDELPNVHVRRGALAGEGRKRQKAVDVRFTVDALSWAQNGAYDVAVLVTGDGDYAPLAEALRDRGIYVAVAAFEIGISDLLKTEADLFFALQTDPAAWASWKFAT